MGYNLLNQLRLKWLKEYLFPTKKTFKEWMDETGRTELLIRLKNHKNKSK